MPGGRPSASSGTRAAASLNRPNRYIDVTKIGNAAIFEGTKGSILADFSSRVIIPANNDGDMTYYKRRSSEQLLPLMGGTGPQPGRDP